MSKRRQTAGGAMTVDAWVQTWTTEPGYQRPKRATNVHNAERVSKFASDFKGTALTEITREQARAWAAENPNRTSEVRVMLNDAVRAGHLSANPFANLGVDRESRQQHIRLEAGDVYSMIRLAEELYPDWPAFPAVIATAAFAGLQIGEISALRWKDIDWRAGSITVRSQYNFRLREESAPRGGQRTVVLMDELAGILRNVPEEGEDGLVFYGRRDHKRYDANANSYYWGQFRDAWWTKLPERRKRELPRDLEFRTLRGFFAFMLAERGAGAEEIAEQLGTNESLRKIRDTYIKPVRQGTSGVDALRRRLQAPRSA